MQYAKPKLTMGDRILICGACGLELPLGQRQCVYCKHSAIQIERKKARKIWKILNTKEEHHAVQR